MTNQPAMPSVLDETTENLERTTQIGPGHTSGAPVPPYEVTIRIEQPMLRRVLRELLDRYLGRKRYIAALIIGYALAVQLLRQHYNWLTWVLIGLLLVAVVVPMLLHSLMFRRWLRQYRAEHGDEARYRFDEHGIEVAAAVGDGQMPWPEFNRLLKLDDAWLLFTQHNAFTILPLQDLEPGLRTLITQKIEANEGEII